MSFLHKSSATDISSSFSNVGLSWDDFVQLAISLTIQAYHSMQQKYDIKQNWEENVFTVNLEDCLRPLAYEYSIFVDTRKKQHTTKMRTGEQATIEAKEMDMSMFGSWQQDYNVVHFVWEAKRIGDKRVSTDYSGLNSEYVHEAIYRFIRNEYAQNVADAGILAYVLAGNVNNIVGDINQSMGNIRKNPALDKSNHLQSISSSTNFQDLYQSEHSRTNNNSIRLHHLFFTFDFS